MNYRREVDGLRSLAVLPVLLFHAEMQAFSGGFVGVDVFFVISGYLITSIIAAELQKGQFSLINFYDRRARRILPALFVVVLASMPLAWLWMRPGELKEFSESVVSVFTFSSNILFWRTTGYFDTDSELKPLLHTWSLAVEEQYYVLFPLILASLWRWGHRVVLVTLGLAACCSLVLAQWGSIADPTAAFFLLPTRGWELLVGAMAALLLAKGRLQGFGEIFNELAALLGLILILGAIFLYTKNTPFPGVYALAPTLGAALIILFAMPQTAVGKLLGSPIPVGIGLISYSTYLWHQPLLAFARYRNHADASTLVMIGMVGLSLVLGYLSWRFVERPFRGPGKFSRAQIVKLGGGISILFIGLGVAGVMTTGFAFRYDDEDRYLATLQNRVMGEYVGKRFKERALKPFEPSDGRRRVLVIGDSFAQDLVNAVFEAGLDEYIQVSTRHIGHECGNLFIEHRRFSDKISVAARRGCDGRGLFEDDSLRALVLSADEIWFSARWHSWQAELIRESVVSLQEFTSKPVRVFGRKDFGKVNINALLASNVVERHAARGVVDEAAINVNALLKASLQPENYVDIQQLLCGEEVKSCRLFIDGGGLISYDGGHLTPTGGKLLGTKLAESIALIGNWPAFAKIDLSPGL